jgi:alpha-beta hydrolase superfamily lysophospholipase
VDLVNEFGANPGFWQSFAAGVDYIQGKDGRLLVHGMWSTEGTLSDVRDAFVEEGYQVEALCLPYHYPKAEHTPASKAKLARTRVQDYVDYVVKQVKRQSSPPILVGHSMGALISQLAAARVPCARLILMSSAAPAGIHLTSALGVFL